MIKNTLYVDRSVGQKSTSLLRRLQLSVCLSKGIDSWPLQNMPSLDRLAFCRRARSLLVRQSFISSSSADVSVYVQWGSFDANQIKSNQPCLFPLGAVTASPNLRQIFTKSPPHHHRIALIANTLHLRRQSATLSPHPTLYFKHQAFSF